MNLHEYQAKEILARYGVPVPPGKVAYTPEEAKRIAEEFGKRVVIKAQVHVGGRGKAGGVKLADTPQEAYEKAQAILGMNIKGLTVKKVLVAEAVDIAKEYYAGLILDRAKKRVVLMLSKEGGVDIEEVAAERPEAIHKFWIDPHKGFRPFEAREMVKRAGLEGNLNKLAQVLVALYRAYEGVDASIAEINPLVVTTDGGIVAADAKIVLDDNALFRHPDLAELREVEAEHPLEVEASNYGFAYVKLDGNIGIIGNGAGLVMYTLDLVNRVGGKPANFLDIGGGASAAVMAESLEIVLSDPQVESVFINVYGGITSCVEVANGILEAVAKLGGSKPIVVRFDGNAAAEGLHILASANNPNIHVSETMEGAAAKAAQLAGEATQSKEVR